MNSSSSNRRLRGAAGAALLAATLLAGGAAFAQTLRPEIGKPLQAAQELIKAQRYKEALGKVREAEAAGARNAEETFLIERMRIAAASGAGDVDTAAKSFEAISGRISAADKIRMTESIAVGYYRAQQYAKAMQWGQRYFKEGGTSGAIRTLLIQSQYLAGDYAGAARELRTEIEQAEKANTSPGEDRLKLLVTFFDARSTVSSSSLVVKTYSFVWSVDRTVVRGMPPSGISPAISPVCSLIITSL